ncbi:MAG: hypothetical protein ACKO4K_06725 [Flavobacteriales bacterium]
MKTLLSVTALTFWLFFFLVPQELQDDKATLTKCVKISCKQTTYVTSITGTNDADIVRQIKERYPNCSFEFLPKSKCKN